MVFQEKGMGENACLRVVARLAFVVTAALAAPLCAASTPHPPVAGTSSSNTGLSVNATYSHTVSADDAAGSNPPRSASTSATPPSGAAPPSGGIAVRYPQDAGIEAHPHVLFVERFDDSLAGIRSRWSETRNAPNMLLDSDVPSGSPGGSRSLAISGAGGGGHLYKNLAAAGLAQNEVLHVRYYIKHPIPSGFAHSGVWMGGYNPPINWPQGGAGSRPAGNDRFVAGAEIIDKSTGWFDHYNYWMGMRSDPNGKAWGNDLLNNQKIRVGDNQWVCVEHMVKLNHPVTEANGEHAIWLDGVKISHLGKNFPKGRWVWDSFIQDRNAATPFEGFQWRRDAALNLNWLWLQNYTPNDPGATLKFDHLVAATSYIGCLSAGGAPPLGDTTRHPAPTRVAGSQDASIRTQGTHRVRRRIFRRCAASNFPGRPRSPRQ